MRSEIDFDIPNPDAPVKHELPVKVGFRSIEQADVHFVLSSWTRSYQGAAHGITLDDYYAGHQQVIGALAARSGLVVACDEETPGFILGWACGELIAKPDASPHLRLHYVYTKHDYRRHRLGVECLKSLGWNPDMRIRATHWNRAAASLSAKFNVTHDPYPLMLGYRE